MAQLLSDQGCRLRVKASSPRMRRFAPRHSGVPFENISVRLGDTSLMPFGRGAARGAVIGANAVFSAAQNLRAKILERAAILLQCGAGDLSIENGSVRRRDGRATDLTIGQIARAVQPGGALFDGEQALEASTAYEAKQVLTSGFSVHVAKVRLDPDIGTFEIDDYVVVHDAGRALNRMIVDGQIVGGVADGIGGAILSEMVYDADGQPLAGSLGDYLVATTMEVPRIRVISLRLALEHKRTWRSPGRRRRHYPGCSGAHQRVGARHRFDPNRSRTGMLFTLPLKPERVYAACRLAATNAAGDE